MTLKIEQPQLVGNVKAVGRLVTNKTIAHDTSYLKVVRHGESYWLAGFGSQHSLLTKLDSIKNKENSISVNLEYNRLWNLIGYLRGEVELALSEAGLSIKDENASTDLINVMADNDDIEDISDLLSEVESLKGQGEKIDRTSFHEAISYLRGIQERDERTDLETGIMLTPEASYVVSDMFAVRYNYEFPFDLVLDSHTTKILLDLLQVNSEEEEITVIPSNGYTWFIIGDSIYQVDGLVDEVDEQYKDVFTHRETDDTITLDRAECLRILNLTKVLTDSVEPDITFKVKDGKGVIYTESRDGDAVDGKFVADKCGDVLFTVSVDDMVSVISKLKNTVGQELTFEVVAIPEEFRHEEMDLLHLKHDLGDCIFSINTAITEDGK